MTVVSAHADRKARLAAVVEAFQKQSEWCRQLAAPFTQRLLAGAAGEIESGGWLATRIGDWHTDPKLDALPLRVAGALHALVIGGRAPELARRYPPHDDPADEALWPTASAALQSNVEVLDDYLARAVQTNEIGRAALLYAGCCELVARHRLPLRVLEFGASAGLNVRFDRYRYRLGDAVRGTPASEVEIACEWSGPLPPAATIDIASRRGCDPAPIDLTDPAQRLRLRSYLWPDHPQRLARLDAAIALALHEGLPTIDAEPASRWLPAQLKERRDGTLTVICQTVVWQYMAQSECDAVTRAIENAGAHATADAPLAWLQFENLKAYGVDVPSGLLLTDWPGGASRQLAEAHPHGRKIRWLIAGN